MERIIKDIQKSAVSLGSCSLVKKVGDFKSLAQLFFSAQGLEFCEDNSFPTIECFRSLKKHSVDRYDVFIDEGYINEIPSENIAFVGDTIADIYCRGSKNIFNVVLAHGAKAVIHADSYAVIYLHIIGNGCNYTLDVDKTVILL